MPRRKTVDDARAVALFRYSLARQLLDPRLMAGERGELARSLAVQQHVGPGGELVWVSRSTLDRWAHTLRVEGFEALAPQLRKVAPRTGADLLELAVALKRERPKRTGAQVARILRQKLGRAPTARTLQRHFRRLGLNRHPQAGAAPRSFGRFEADFADELWLCDGLHAGTVRGPIIDGRQTVLYAIIDDHSRYIVHGRWGFAEDVVGLLALLHDAVKVHGCPTRFYTDHGGAFLSHQLAWSLAVLGIRIIHSRQGRPEGRGKIEKWNKTCREEFLVEVETGGGTGGSSVSSLAELNQLFHAWLHHSYHQRVHSQTGQTPAERYHHRADDTPTPHRPGTDQLWRAFRWHVKRKVTKWRTVSLLGNRYEVAAGLVGETVDLLFNPLDLTRIDVELRGEPKGQAHPHTITRHVHPDVKLPLTAKPAPATGIDYLRLLEAAHQSTVGTAINFAALVKSNPATADSDTTDGDPSGCDTTPNDIGGDDDERHQC